MKDKEKTSFTTHNGHYKFKVMPFDFTNTFTTFQPLMNSVLELYLKMFVIVFYDILIHSSSMELHINPFRTKSVRSNQLYVK